MIEEFFNNHSESEQISFLKDHMICSTQFEENDLNFLQEYVTEDYALIAVIGLILNDGPRILMGTLQPFDEKLKVLCLEKKINKKILEDVAEKFISDDFNEASEFVYRKLMSEFPKDRS